MNKDNSEKSQINNLLSKFFKSTRRYNWKYLDVIDFDYDRNNDNCHCPDYCRCSVIVNIELTRFSMNNMIDILLKNINSQILKYSIDRIIRSSKLNENDFNLVTCGGYYGEEVDGLYLSEEKNKFLSDKISELIELSDIDKIKYVLNLEYGHLLDVVKESIDFSIENINMNNINFQDDYRKKIDVTENFYDEKFQLPRGIFVKSGDRYRLIDGYHRVMKAKSMNYFEVKGIVLV